MPIIVCVSDVNLMWCENEEQYGIISREVTENDTIVADSEVIELELKSSHKVPHGLEIRKGENFVAVNR